MAAFGCGDGVVCDEPIIFFVELRFYFYFFIAVEKGLEQRFCDNWGNPKNHVSILSGLGFRIRTPASRVSN